VGRRCPRLSRGFRLVGGQRRGSASSSDGFRTCVRASVRVTHGKYNDDNALQDGDKDGYIITGAPYTGSSFPHLDMD